LKKYFIATCVCKRVCDTYMSLVGGGGRGSQLVFDTVRT
jgi:hypothetical protein